MFSKFKYSAWELGVCNCSVSASGCSRRGWSEHQHPRCRICCVRQRRV